MGAGLVPHVRVHETRAHPPGGEENLTAWGILPPAMSRPVRSGCQAGYETTLGFRAFQISELGPEAGLVLLSGQPFLSPEARPRVTLLSLFCVPCGPQAAEHTQDRCRGVFWLSSWLSHLAPSVRLRCLKLSPESMRLICLVLGSVPSTWPPVDAQTTPLLSLLGLLLSSRDSEFG